MDFSKTADLKLCNLVSRGYSMVEAKKYLGIPVDEETKKAADVVVEVLEEVEVNLEVNPEEDEKEELRNQLKELGVRFSPNAGVKNLREKLKIAQQNEDIL